MTKWIGEVWYGGKKATSSEDFSPKDSPRQAYEDALEWAHANCRNFAQATCYGVRVDDPDDHFDEWSHAWLGLEGDEATTTISQVVAFTVGGQQIVAIDEEGVRHPLRHVGGLLSSHARFLHASDEDGLWAAADVLAEEYMKELVHHEQEATP